MKTYEPLIFLILLTCEFFLRDREGENRMKWSTVKYVDVLIFLFRFKENIQQLQILVQSLFQIWNFVIFQNLFPRKQPYLCPLVVDACNFAVSQRKLTFFSLSVHNESASKCLNNNATLYTYPEEKLMELSCIYFQNASKLHMEKNRPTVQLEELLRSQKYISSQNNFCGSFVQQNAVIL